MICVHPGFGLSADFRLTKQVLLLKSPIWYCSMTFVFKQIALMKNNHLCENSLMFGLQRDTPLATRTSEKAIGPIRKTTILHMQHNFCLAVLHKHGENSLSETKKNVSFSLWTCVQSPRIQLPENLPTVDILTNSPLDILPKKCVLKLSGHYRAIKSLTLPRSRLCCTLRGLLIQMQNINLRSSDIRRKQNWLLLFAFSSPLFCRFSCLIFFSLSGHLY